MFVPLGDDNPLKRIRFQYVTVSLILVNVLVFALQLLAIKSPAVLGSFAVVPDELMHAGFPGIAEHTQDAVPVPERLTLISYMFLHGDFFHLAGNMLFLWVFGDNVEDALGHVLYLVFYLVCGLAATFTQIAIDPNSPVPTLGASGAISGVLAGYLIFFPGARVKIIIPVYFIPFRLVVSAAFLLIGWIALQIFSGAVSVMQVDSGEGVAWFAHIGGFAMGLALCGLWRAARGPVRG